MTTKQPSLMAIIAGRCLRKAVREELQRKALLGQYVIINRNGKLCLDFFPCVSHRLGFPLV